MTTFSQLVDDILVEMVRPDLRNSIIAYANQTLREIQLRPNSNTAVNYDANRFEVPLAFSSDGMWLWSLPSATRFQDVEAIYVDDLGLYVPKRNPRIALEFSFEPNPDLYWYRSGAQIAINGVLNGWTGKISYFMYTQTLAYKAAGARIITYNVEDDTYLLASSGGVPTEEELATETNWILQRWADTVKEGVRAKAYKRLADETRARMAYSSFETGRLIITQSEPSSS